MQVLEIGQVGQAGSSSGQTYSFYAHSQKAPAFGDSAALVAALQQGSQQTRHLQVEAMYNMMLMCFIAVKKDTLFVTLYSPSVSFCQSIAISCLESI